MTLISKLERHLNNSLDPRDLVFIVYSLLNRKAFVQLIINEDVLNSCISLERQCVTVRHVLYCGFNTGLMQEFGKLLSSLSGLVNYNDSLRLGLPQKQFE